MDHDFDHPHGEPFEAEEYEEAARSGLFEGTLFDLVLLACVLVTVALMGWLNSKMT